ncbi:MAG: hypothetical protein IJD12_06160 [Tidjanibacter sp.]|nr:hypothetical protein [Tidjanibacter sp.]
MLFFTSEEKAAIMRLAMAMVSIDGEIAKKETALCVLVSTNLEMDDSELELSEALDFAQATYIVSNMTKDEKTFVCSFIAKIITTDGVRHPAELKLWNLMSAMCNFHLSLDDAVSKFFDYV